MKEDKITNPFSYRKIGSEEPFVRPEEAKLISEHNAKVARKKNSDDLTLHHLHPVTGKLLPPMCWSGNPQRAAIMLLLKNPSWDLKSLNLITQPEHFRRFEKVAHCIFEPEEYHNPYLHPDYRRHDRWHANLFRDLHQEISWGLGWDEEKTWLFLSQQVCIMELVPWRSRYWSDSAVVSNIHLDFVGPWVRKAMADPDRIVLMGRGEKQWKMMVDAAIGQQPKVKNPQRMSLNRGNLQHKVYQQILDMLIHKALFV